MIRSIVIFFLLICPLGVTAQETLTLSDCISKALESNYGIRIAKNEEQIERNNQNYSSFLPSFSAEGTQKESIINSKRKDANSGTEKKFSGSITDNYGANINLNWTIFDGLAMFTTHEKLNEFIAIGELKTRMAVENLIAQVNTEYYNVLVQKSLLDAAKQSLDLSRQRYEIALQKNRIGSLSGLELKQTKIDLNSDSSTLVKQQEQLRSAYITLNTLMNIDLHKRGYVKDTILLHPMYPKDEVQTLMLNNNTTLLIARREQKVSELDLKLARSAYFPSVDFTAGIFVDGIPERDGYFFNLLFSQRLYVELADCGADMLVMVNKSQHTLFGMVFKSVGNLGECLLMERNVIFLVSQYRVIAPDHFLFSYFIRKAFEYVYSFVDRRQIIF